MKSPWLLYCLVCLTPVLCPFARANMTYDGNLSYAHTGNATNAILDEDIYTDYSVSANLNIGKLWLPAVGKSILLQGHLGMEEYDNSEGLDRYQYGTSLAYIQRLGLGAYAPRFNVAFSAMQRDFETDMRDGLLYRAGLTLEKRFTPGLHAAIGLTREKRTADADLALSYYRQLDSDVYNQENNELAASMDYTLENNAVITARYILRDGEVDASTNPASNFFFYATAVAQDYEVCDVCAEYVAYLVDARVHTLQLDWNWALGRDASVSAILERRVANTRGDNTYTTNIFRIQLNRRF